MILVYVSQLESAHVLLQNAAKLAVSLKKDLGILHLVPQQEMVDVQENISIQLLTSLGLDIEAKVLVQNGKMSDLEEVCEKEEASFLFVQLTANQSKMIQSALNACRYLRIPYLLHKDTFGVSDFAKVLVPVGFLEEELEKAQFASAFGRFCNSHIQLLLANDSGSKAARNADKMKSLFEQFTLVYTEKKGKQDSFKIDKESVAVAAADDFGIIIVSASRDYGLDDIIFGPKEFHLVKSSSVPVLLVNPRGDLYALCD